MACQCHSVDVMRLNILSSGLLDPIGNSRVKVNTKICICLTRPIGSYGKGNVPIRRNKILLV